MAENEYLDVTKSRRWQAVVQAIRDGLDTDGVFWRFRRCLYKTVQQFCKELPFAELIESVDDPKRLADLADRLEGGHDVKGLLLFAAEEASGPVNVIEDFLNLSVDGILHDIPYYVAQTDPSINLSGLRNEMRTVRNEMSPDIRHIAEKLANNPSGPLRRPRDPTSAKQTSTERTIETLRELLIR